MKSRFQRNSDEKPGAKPKTESWEKEQQINNWEIPSFRTYPHLQEMGQSPLMSKRKAGVFQQFCHHQKNVPRQRGETLAGATDLPDETETSEMSTNA
ncbi:hypothetical protein AVEN_269344-1 [Araneus ventricosus]|uniref:Uncharacterized protein n=1 Tax=Araneus ventricosus TaxID=182803 RepID=A0A4Y2M938_ARAVE|nr:hypothetical protein AVEN_269344-1 [Araneus ventricosus]